LIEGESMPDWLIPLVIAIITFIVAPFSVKLGEYIFKKKYKADEKADESEAKAEEDRESFQNLHFNDIKKYVRFYTECGWLSEGDLFNLNDQYSRYKHYGGNDDLVDNWMKDMLALHKKQPFPPSWNPPINEESTSTKGHIILAVDDMNTSLRLIEQALSEYEVHTTTDPSKVEDILRKITPQLIILDYEMPEMSGFDLIPIIRGFKVHRTTPIIMLTAINTNEMYGESLKYGIAEYITKPFSSESLQLAVSKHIKKG